MNITAAIILGVFVFLTFVLVIAMFIWAAVKDGQEDKALQTRLGIRRRTRIGRELRGAGGAFFQAAMPHGRSPRRWPLLYSVTPSCPTTLKRATLRRRAETSGGAGRGREEALEIARPDREEATR
jgi:hypothetical protein